MSAWIDSNRSAKRRKRGRKTAYKRQGRFASNDSDDEEVSETQS